MSEQTPIQNDEELNVEELEDVAGGAISAEQAEASTNIGCTNYGCS